jgi:hypothetical protein
MHLHGGRIGVYSEGEGKGTTFVVDLPIHRRERHPKSKSYSAINLLPKVKLAFEKNQSFSLFNFLYFRLVGLRSDGRKTKICQVINCG